MRKSNVLIIIIISIIIILIIGALIAMVVWNRNTNENVNEKIQTKVSEVILDECTDEYEMIEQESISANSKPEKVDDNCGEHYILKDEDGKISIYKISEDGKEDLYEKTNISIEYLPEKDKNAIRDGLKVNGKEKLNKLIEDFE